LVNHRKMLVYELAKARNEVEKAKAAVSAVEQAKALHQPVDEAHAAHVLDRSLVNLAYQRNKIGKLDDHGEVVLDKGQGTITVSEQVRKDSRAKTVVSSGAASSFEPLPKPAYAAARQAPPAPEADLSDWYRAIENDLPADAAACAAAVAPQARDSKEPPIGQDFTGPVQAFTRKPQEQAHAAASASSPGSGSPFQIAIDAVVSASARPLAVQISSEIPPPPPFLRPSTPAGQPTAMRRATTARPTLRTRMKDSDSVASACAEVASARPEPPAFPMPTRLAPFVLEGRHETAQAPLLDVDWTLCEDRGEEMKRRKMRNEMIKDKLKAGRSVCYRSSGWSLYPRVHCNDQTIYDPVTSDDQVQVGDIVFCQVQPYDRFFAHLVKEKNWRNAAWCFIISNIAGYVNGWCFIEHIYGRLVEVLH
jgi:hypothetical protein